MIMTAFASLGRLLDGLRRRVDGLRQMHPNRSVRSNARPQRSRMMPQTSCSMPCRALSSLVVVLNGLWLATTPMANAAERPNFVIVLCDDLGYGDLGCYGHPHIRTPRLDQLAREGWRLTQCYAAAPVCSPSRAGLMTGRTPQRLGIIDWIPPGSPMHLRSSEQTVATLLKRLGYRTCLSGKWHLNGEFNQPTQPQPHDHGFDHWFATQNNAAPSHENPINLVRNGQPVGPLQGYSSDLLVQEALSWLDQGPADRPFFLYVPLHSPHEPVATDRSFVKKYPQARTPDEAQYWGNVSQVDAAVGTLLDGLERRGLSENTLVFFSSDNGPETLNRYKTAFRSYGSPGPLRGMKLHLTEAGIRVPGLLKWPARIAPGQVIETPVAFVDVLPTFIELAGATVPTDRHLDGTSWRSWLLNGQPLSRSQPLYWQYDRAIGGPYRYALRDGRWKLLVDAQRQHPALFDLANDPAEAHDLSGREPQQVQQLLARLNQIRESVERERPEWPPGPGTNRTSATVPKAAAVK
jgi:arylsulfatase A